MAERSGVHGREWGCDGDCLVMVLLAGSSLVTRGTVKRRECGATLSRWWTCSWAGPRRGSVCHVFEAGAVGGGGRRVWKSLSHGLADNLDQAAVCALSG